MPSSTWPRVSDDVWARRIRLLALWSGILVGPTLWLALLEANYALSYVACAGGRIWFLHATVGLAAICTALAGFWGWRTGAHSANDRERWMGHAGAAMSLFFLLVIFSFEAPLLILKPCV